MNGCHWLFFIGGVSIAGAFRIEDTIWRVLFIISAVISLTLAITRMLKNRSIAKKIKTLEEHQLSVRYDDKKEILNFEKGVK